MLTHTEIYSPDYTSTDNRLEGRGASPARFVPGLARFAAPLGRFAVTGNHENHGGSGSASAAFRAAGFAVLRDGWTEAAPGLVIAGIDDRGWGGAGDVQGAAIVRALAGRPEGAVVLLAHNPASAAAATAAGVGLMISGHTHGGQIWPFGLLVERVQPLLAGRYDVGGMALLVGRGAGTWGPRMRLWHRGEILRVVLRPA